MLQSNWEAKDADVPRETFQEGFERRPEGLERRHGI